MARRQRIVAFGGTFDPVHNGHLIAVRAAAEQRGFERIMLVPAASPPHKSAAAAAGPDRLRMIRRAVEGDPLFEVCDLELHRRGPSYTIDTLRELRSAAGEGASLHWLIGADMLAQLPTWHRVEEVLDAAEVVTLSRPPWDRRLEGILADLEGALGAERVARLRKAIVLTPLIDISSTDIRRRARTGRSIRYLLPDAVADYIRRNRIYT
jgi:nicotinate-nucleotide adenylyltransferase